MRKKWWHQKKDPKWYKVKKDWSFLQGFFLDIQYVALKSITYVWNSCILLLAAPVITPVGIAPFLLLLILTVSGGVEKLTGVTVRCSLKPVAINQTCICQNSTRVFSLFSAFIRSIFKPFLFSLQEKRNLVAWQMCFWWRTPLDQKGEAELLPWAFLWHHGYCWCISLAGNVCMVKSLHAC